GASTAHLELIAANQLLAKPYGVADLKEFFVFGCTDDKWRRKVQDLTFSGSVSWDSDSVSIEQIIKKMDSYSGSSLVNVKQLANDVTKSVRADLQKELARVSGRGEYRPSRNTNMMEWVVIEGEPVGHYLPDANASDAEFELFYNTSVDLANEDAKEKNEDGLTTKQKLAFKNDIRNYRRNPEEFKAGFRSDLFGRDNRNHEGGSFQRDNNFGRFRNSGPGPARTPYRVQPSDRCPRHGDAHLFRDCPNRAEIDGHYDKIFYDKCKLDLELPLDDAKLEANDTSSSITRNDKFPFSLL
ncbi:hypothetical protein HDU76_010947, partial [Blyttiomyces sp. JEL0837]